MCVLPLLISIFLPWFMETRMKWNQELYNIRSIKYFNILFIESWPYWMQVVIQWKWQSSNSVEGSGIEAKESALCFGITQWRQWKWMHLCMDELALGSETLTSCISFIFSATLRVTNGTMQVNSFQRQCVWEMKRNFNTEIKIWPFDSKVIQFY